MISILAKIDLWLFPGDVEKIRDRGMFAFAVLIPLVLFGFAFSTLIGRWAMIVPALDLIYMILCSGRC